MFAIRENEYDITNFGTIVTVPNNPIARCMYYLNCVDTVLDIDEFWFLTDYAKYYLLDNSDKAKLLLLCKTFSPDVLEDVFEEVSHLPNTSNKFYELGLNQTSIAATSQIVIGGITRKVLKVMFYTREWVDRNYYTPIAQLSYDLRRQPSRTVLYRGNDDCVIC